eukprot:TRINITY_DN15814_c0_g1_i2.p1 TRINITY_DN15814_c0_g1~~TRINITY_DN15814_c0_g1_i2.p1  ORF type:complete len:494 (+),score=111.85 TRINITY_DN15814_c0_g1_i2:77-1558(+)
MGSVGTDTDHDRLYKLLEIGKNASRGDIKKAHQKMARKHHPDRGGDPEIFKEVQRAYEILIDPEKRSTYDRYGEKGLEEGAGSPHDFFDLLRGGMPGSQRVRRPTTKSIVKPLKVTLEQLYSGTTKKMAITRQVIDKSQPIENCSVCDGTGVSVQTVRRGNIVQRMQSNCTACGSTGKSFKLKEEREIVEVHVQKGATDEQRIVFHEKADELPGADTGDVTFILQSVEHPVFKRKGADLFIEKDISLAEALTGFQLEVTHLDGRKLLIKTSPDEIIQPMSRGLDYYLKVEEDEVEWDCFEDCDCPDIENVAQAEEIDEELLKKLCCKQLKNRGLDVGAFVVDGTKASFKQCTHTEAHAAKKPCAGSKLFILADPKESKPHRMIKAVPGQGMPTLKNPFLYGNLFFLFNIKFPESISPQNQEALRQILPPALNVPSVTEDDMDVEVHTLTDMDIKLSQASNSENMKSASEAYDEDDDMGVPGMPGGQGPQCQQM